jgi:hypothetical protein
MPWTDADITASVRKASRRTVTTTDKTRASRWPALRENFARMLLAEPDIGFYYFKMSCNRVAADCGRIAQNLCTQIELTEELLPTVAPAQAATNRPLISGLKTAAVDSAQGRLDTTLLRQVQNDTRAALRYDSAYLKRGRILARPQSEVFAALEPLERDLAQRWELVQFYVQQASSYAVNYGTAQSLAVAQPLNALEQAETTADAGNRFLLMASSLAAIDTFQEVPALTPLFETQVKTARAQFAALSLASSAELDRKPNFSADAPQLLQRMLLLAKLAQLTGELSTSAQAAIRRMGGSVPAAPETTLFGICAEVDATVTRKLRDTAIGALDMFRNEGFSLADDWCTQFRLMDVLNTNDGRKLIPQEAIADATNQITYVLATDADRQRYR